MQIGLSREANHCLASLRVRALINNRRPILAVRPPALRRNGRTGWGVGGWALVFLACSTKNLQILLGVFVHQKFNRHRQDIESKPKICPS